MQSSFIRTGRIPRIRAGVLVFFLLVAPVLAWESLTFDLPSGGKESLWRDALSRHWNGQVEQRIEGGRVDVVTDRYAIEVEFPHKWHEGLGQALHYASATGKQGVLAIIAYAQGEANLQENSRRKLEMIEQLCAANRIRLVVLFPNRPEEFGHRAAPAPARK